MAEPRVSFLLAPPYLYQFVHLCAFHQENALQKSPIYKIRPKPEMTIAKPWVFLQALTFRSTIKQGTFTPGNSTNVLHPEVHHSLQTTVINMPNEKIMTMIFITEVKISALGCWNSNLYKITVSVSIGDCEADSRRNCAG